MIAVSTGVLGAEAVGRRVVRAGGARGSWPGRRRHLGAGATARAGGHFYIYLLMCDL